MRFDETVPVETIDVIDPAIESIPEAEREVIGEKVSHRLAQEPGSYKILRYVRQVVKRRDTGELVTPPAPPNVLERTCVDVSFLAGMLVDKCGYSSTIRTCRWIRMIWSADYDPFRPEGATGCSRGRSWELGEWA